MLVLLSRQATEDRRYGQSGKLAPPFSAREQHGRDDVRGPARRIWAAPIISISIL
jgi:hypothetical protein